MQLWGLLMVTLCYRAGSILQDKLFGIICQNFGGHLPHDLLEDVVNQNIDACGRVKVGHGNQCRSGKGFLRRTIHDGDGVALIGEKF